MINLYFIGSAGSGKSTLTGAYAAWMEHQGYSAITVNLDPGIENAPYVPDIDIRDWIELRDVMDEYGVGPNGAQIVAADLLALNIGELKEEIESYETDHVILDTPGQMELFVLRESGKFLIDALGASESLISFLYDPVISRSPSGFISLMLQAASIEVRFNVPFISVLAKSDLLAENDRERILDWSRDLMVLDDAIHDETPTLRNDLNIEIMSAIRSFGEGHPIIPVSSTAPSGMEDIYNAVQMVFYGGEDLREY